MVVISTVLQRPLTLQSPNSRQLPVVRALQCDCWRIYATRKVLNARLVSVSFQIYRPFSYSLQWRHNERDGFSNHRRLDRLLNSRSCAGQRTYQSFAPMPFVRGIHRWLENSQHKGPVTRKFFPFVDVIMFSVALTTGRCKSGFFDKWQITSIPTYFLMVY